MFALDSLSTTAERTLKLIAKYLQNLANQVEFRTKVGHTTVKLVVAMVLLMQEQYMIVLNDHLKDNMERMRRFIDSLSVSISKVQKFDKEKL